MKNPEHAQHFADVDIDKLGYGGLSGIGAAEHGQASARPVQDGVKVALNCDNCGAPNVLTIEWPEAVIISTGHLPRGWKIQSGYIRPDLGCANCNRLVTPGVTPDEAHRWVKAGIAARFISPQQAQAIAQQAQRGGVL
jgi:hypothetical protein